MRTRRRRRATGRGTKRGICQARRWPVAPRARAAGSPTAATQCTKDRAPFASLSDWFEKQHRKARGCSQQTTWRHDVEVQGAVKPVRAIARGEASPADLSRCADLENVLQETTNNGGTQFQQETRWSSTSLFGMTWLVLSTKRCSLIKKKPTLMKANYAVEVTALLPSLPPSRPVQVRCCAVSSVTRGGRARARRGTTRRSGRLRARKSAPTHARG